MDPQRLWELIQDALKQGGSPDLINANLYKLSDGKYARIEELEQDLFRVQNAERALNQHSRGGVGGDILTKLAQGALFNMGDELGLVNKERSDALSVLRPNASLAVEAVGGALLPGGIGAKAGRNIAARTGSKLAGAMAGGAAGGLAGGAVQSFGAAEGGPAERLDDALLGGAAGGTFGAVLGLLGSTGRRGAERLLPSKFGTPPGPLGTRPRGTVVAGARANLERSLKEGGIPPADLPGQVRAHGEQSVVADLAPNLAHEARGAINQARGLLGRGGPIEKLAQRTVSRGDELATQLEKMGRITKSYEESLREAVEGKAAVREQFYRPLEERYPDITDPALLEVLQDWRIAPVVAKLPRRPDQKGVSFAMLQDVRKILKDAAEGKAEYPHGGTLAREARDDLDNAMKDRLPGYRDANRAYWGAKRREAAHELGTKFVDRPAREIQKEIEALPAEARDAFRLGVITRMTERLRNRDTGSGTATGLIHAGDEPKKKLRAIAGSSAEYKEYLRVLDQWRDYERTWGLVAGGSPTGGQVADMMTQIATSLEGMPTTPKGIFMRAASKLIGLSPAERRAVMELYGRALLTDGEEAAELLLQDITVSTALTGGPAAVGAGIAGAAGSELGRKRGG